MDDDIYDPTCSGARPPLDVNLLRTFSLVWTACTRISEDTHYFNLLSGGGWAYLVADITKSDIRSRWLRRHDGATATTLYPFKMYM